MIVQEQMPLHKFELIEKMMRVVSQLRLALEIRSHDLNTLEQELKEEVPHHQ